MLRLQSCGLWVPLLQWQPGLNWTNRVVGVNTVSEENTTRINYYDYVSEDKHWSEVVRFCWFMLEHRSRRWVSEKTCRSTLALHLRRSRSQKVRAENRERAAYSGFMQENNTSTCNMTDRFSTYEWKLLLYFWERSDRDYPRPLLKPLPCPEPLRLYTRLLYSLDTTQLFFSCFSLFLSTI